ncbi:MAG: hypothetical protein SGILL_004714 [Bacillariaceae sp.]
MDDPHHELQQSFDFLTVLEPPSSPHRRRGSSSLGSLHESASFRIFKDLECKDEFQKVRLAGFLRELNRLATEDTKEKVRSSILVSTTTTAANGGDAASGEFDNTFALDDVDLDALTPTQATAKIAAFRDGKRIKSGALMMLIQTAIELIGQEETVVDLRKLEPTPQKLTVVGDLHGSLSCLMNVLRLVGIGVEKDENDNTVPPLDPARVIVFDGDYVDRGKNSLEVIATLCLLKLSHPKNVFLLRGNHEDTMTASTYGFRDEIDDKYGPTVGDMLWHEFGNLFASFPIIARSNVAAIMHGGIPAEDFHLDSVNKISSALRCELTTVADPIDDIELLVQGFLWSDPTTDDGLYFSDRGAGYHFGNDISRNFLKTHGLKYIIRAHEPFESGSNHQDIEDNGKAVITVFSTANYPCGQGSNMGAVLHLDETTQEYETVQFKFDAGNEQNGASAYEMLLRPFIDENKSKLTKAFRKVQNNDNGYITIQQWAEVVAEALELPDVPWIELQPEMAPTVENNWIDWWSFLDNAGTPIPHLERLRVEDLELLHQHKDKFLNIFQVLDTDRSGTISKEEFVTGIETLNDEIPDDQKKMQNAAELFHVFDVDGDQQISIDEFVDAIANSSTMQNVTDSLNPEQVETLHSNHEMLLTAFRYLDTDHSGTIDREEFHRGIDALNNRLPERQKLGDPAELFDLLDSDGNGVIDLNEFNRMFLVM